MCKNLNYILILPTLAPRVGYFLQIPKNSCNQWMAVGLDCIEEGCGARRGKGVWPALIFPHCNWLKDSRSERKGKSWETTEKTNAKKSN